MPQRNAPETVRTQQTRNPSGVHFLSGHAARRLVGKARVGAGDLVLDLGAGPGAVTVPLAATGANVVAVERDTEFAHELRRRLAAHDNVRVVTDDATTVPLPRRGFHVVASIPYAVSTTVLRRLLSPHRTTLRGASLVVEWGFAKRVTAAVPKDRETAWWAARFDVTLVERVPASAFRPAPRVGSAHLRVRPATPLSEQAQGALWALLSAAYRSPRQPARRAVRAELARRNPHRVLTGAGIDPDQPAGWVRPRRWATLAERLAADGTLPWLGLPRRLRTRG